MCKFFTSFLLLILTACQPSSLLDSSMPHTDPKLIEISKIDHSIKIDLRYQTANNIAKKSLYHPDFPAMLRSSTVHRLKNANRQLKKNDLRLVIWDAYRPHEAQLALWDASGHDDRFVANPERHPSLHSHGCAVDVTLVHLDGRAAAVPTGFDDFSPQAGSDFVHHDPRVRENMRLLKAAMWEAGFGTLPQEWWHFMDKDYRSLPFIPTAELPDRLQQMIQQYR